MKCNMCVHRTEDGTAKPMCVEKCPMQAITVERCEALKYVVLGSSAAGVNGVRELRKSIKTVRSS